MKKQYKTLILIEMLIIIIIGLLVIFLNSKYIQFVPKCVFKENFGIICPACNGTTFAIELAKLNFVKAFKTHPIFFVLVVYLGILNIFYIINVLFKKDIKIFKWWHTLIWIIALLIYTLIKNIF